MGRRSPLCLVLKYRVKAAYNVFNKISFPVSGLFEGQLSGLGEFLMGFAKNHF